MAVDPLFSRCTEVIMRNGPRLLQQACTMLPPSLLRYLLYRAVKNGDVTYIECLVRHWPLEILSFDMYNFIIDDDIGEDYLDRDYLPSGIRNYLYWIGNDNETYLQRHHSWFCSSRYPQLQFDEAMVNAIARGVYSRVFESQSVEQAATSGTKLFIIDMSMVRLEDPDNSDLLMPLMNLCFGTHPSKLVNYHNNLPERLMTCTSSSERVVIKVSENNNLLSSFCNTTPCALISEFIWLPYHDASVGMNVLQALDNMTSLHFVLTSSNCGAELAKILISLKEKGLNEISIMDCRNLNLDFVIPAVPCRRIAIETGYFTSLFNCAYHPCGKLQSLHVSAKLNDSNLKFDSKIFKVIEHNCESLLDLRMSGVKVANNRALLLQETFQKCRALVILNIHNSNDGTLASARLHEIFFSMQGLVSLERLSVSDPINVFGKDLYALRNLLYQGLPNLKECCLTFQQLIIYFTLLEDPNFEPIQELLAALLSGKQPSPDCHTVAFKWRNNQTVHAWLTSLCCNVNFNLSRYS